MSAIAGDVRVTDTLPAQLTPTAAGGPGFTCTIAGSVVTCLSTTPIALGEQRAIDVTVTVASNAVGSAVTNTASVGSLLTGDVVPSDNLDQATGTVTSGDRLPTAGAAVGGIVATALGLLLVGGLFMAVSRGRRRPSRRYERLARN